MNKDVLFSHKKEDWVTPDNLYENLHAEFDFKMDLAASKDNAKHFNFTDDLFNFDFSTIPRGCALWLNPPYGPKAKDFLLKALQLKQDGYTVVCLLPARTDTKWFHDIVLPNAELRFIKGRIKFKDALYSAPFPSMLAIFR